MIKSFTPATVRGIVKARGIDAAELALEDAESQIGRAKCAAARAEFDRLFKAAFDQI